MNLKYKLYIQLRLILCYCSLDLDVPVGSCSLNDSRPVSTRVC